MTEVAIDRVSPLPAEEGLGDERIAELYAEGAGDPWLRVNFVSSIDGAATRQGLSGGLSDDADHRVFDILRRLCDVVVVGAGTVRAEGYGAMRVDEASQRARRDAGLTAHPAFAIVSASLDLDPASPIFRDAPQRPIIVTTELSRRDTREALAEVADVVVCGAERVEPGRLVAGLVERGLTRIHCEGGPHLFGDLIAAGAVDELCLTVSPTLEAGVAMRISAGAAPILPVGMRLAHVLQSGDTLLLRYVRRA
ncbi:pyrimidine reductase family protein [Leifsonia shinshuensis]|uniref:Riboflavin biosynthesis pyrimidine reductase n=1 Tax=Leifsonia shinshuensis TaxID=150026 RepID=A0A853CV21_9MICO|nr:pyrimidine reductase family protein [Leifsonia shinshuensis]NYJ23271.1 riboflavin biosynthesis pyrimidine reductase [Leifsonia shinshuensis]